MLHFQGDKQFEKAPAEVAAKLSDARFLAQCIPGAEAVTIAESDHVVCTLRPGFAFVRGTLELTLRVIERLAGSSVRLHLHSKGIGTTSNVEASMEFSAADGGSRVVLTVEITELGGLLKAVPQGLTKAAAQKVIADAWTAVEARLTAPG